jgi:isopenicillin N synthase-like dioxygenase
VNSTDTAQALLDDGYARVRLTGPNLDALRGLRTAAAEFFRRGEADKLRHGSDDFNFGFRRFGRQFSITPDVPDMCESFAYWSDDPSLVPHHQGIESFIAALRAYRATAAGLTTDVLDGLAAHYGYTSAIDFGRASYIEVNWYVESSDRDLLQERHEDGHILSLVAPDRAGLEIEVVGEMRAQSFEEGDVVIMPGALLTTMTGGAIAPMYHQVRNYHFPERTTVLYFVNAPFDGSVEPYVVTDLNRGVDIAQVSRQNSKLYGRSEPPVLA